MIEAALNLFADQLDQGLRRRSSGTDRLVVVSDLTDGSGSGTAESAGKVVVTLVNIVREDVSSRMPQRFDGGQARLGMREAPIHVSLLAMVSANFSGSHYAEGLKQIAGVLAFFQGKPLFTKSNAPDLDVRIEQLSVTIENLAITDLSNVWGMLGGRYVPSVLYRIRLLAIDALQLAAQEPRVEDPHLSLLAGPQ